LAPTELSDALQAALINVCENAYFVFVEPCDVPQFEALVRSSGEASTPWLRAMVHFTGDTTGHVEIALPERLGAWLVTSLLGMAPEEILPPHQLADGVAEFTNMVCGAWLSNLSDETLFTLQAPHVAPVAPGWTPLAQTPDDGWRRVNVNDMPMQIRARW
jgi:CheY-specific phosphatase CheX